MYIAFRFKTDTVGPEVEEIAEVFPKIMYDAFFLFKKYYSEKLKQYKQGKKAKGRKSREIETLVIRELKKKYNGILERIVKSAVNRAVSLYRARAKIKKHTLHNYSTKNKKRRGWLKYSLLNKLKNQEEILKSIIAKRFFFIVGERNKKGNPIFRFRVNKFIEIYRTKNRKIVARGKLTKNQRLFLEKVQKLAEEKKLAYSVSFKKLKNGWQFSIVFDYNYDFSFDRVIGLDLNEGTLGLCILDIKTGNPISFTSFSFKDRNDLRKIIDTIIILAKGHKAVIAYEKLSHRLRMSQNRSKIMPRRFRDNLKKKAMMNNIGVIEVNHAGTTYMAEIKYSRIYKRNLHEISALLIARRALGWSFRVKYDDVKRLKRLNKLVAGQIRYHGRYGVYQVLP